MQIHGNCLHTQNIGECKYMKITKRVISLLLSCLIVAGNVTVRLNAKENEDIIVQDKIVSQEEYIHTVSKYENLSYKEAAEEIKQDRIQARVEPESVVTILRSVTKVVNGSFSLTCTAYLDVVRDNLTNKYIEIIAVRAPYVDLTGPITDSTMSGSYSPVYSGTRATVYCNGAVTYTLSTSASIGTDIQGVQVGFSAGGNTIYRYPISTSFVFIVA